MNPNDPNIQMVETVAAALGELRNHLVFVGGCATGLLIADDGRPPVRATKDVDLIAEVATHAEYYVLHDQLRRAGFKEDTELTCRWTIGQILVDVMPTDEKVLGFVNRWYPSAIADAQDVALPKGTVIKLVTPPLFVATKLEAFHGRGKGDFASHDLEDIVVLIDGRPQIVEEVQYCRNDVREYLLEEIDFLLSQRDFVDTLPWHFATDVPSQERIPIVIDRLRKIAGI